MAEKIRFAFYKSQKGDFWGNLISGWTGLFTRGIPNYCHVEIGMLSEGIWKWYSSASRNYDGTAGTRWITETELFRNRKRWDIYECSAFIDTEKMIDICLNECGKKYDWLGIAGFATVFGSINARNKWYCSEICHYVAFGKWKKRISPKALAKKLFRYPIKKVESESR